MEARKAVFIIFLCNNLVFVATQCTFNGYSSGKNNLDCSRMELVNTYGINVNGLLLSLDLSYNEFTRVTETAFVDLRFRSLNELNLSFNKIERVGVSAFNSFTALKRLDLSHNQIKILDLYFWPDLLMLNVSFNYLNSISAVQCRTLEVLDISNNAVQDLILADEAINVKHLNITSNQIKTLPSEILLRLPLFSLQIRGNKIRCDSATTNLLQDLSNRGVDVNPTCPSIQTVNVVVPSIAPHKKLIPENSTVTPTNAVLASFENDVNLEALERNQLSQLHTIFIILFTQIAVISLLIFNSILLITFRLRDTKKKRHRMEFPLEEIDDEVPPPPYRNHSSGFVI